MNIGANVSFDGGQLAEGCSRGQHWWARHPAGHNYATAEAGPAKFGPQAHDALFVPGQASVGDGLPSRFSMPGCRVEMVGYPLQLGVHRSDQHGPRRDSYLSGAQRLDGLGESHGVRHRGHSLHPLGQQDAIGRRQPLKADFDSTVFVVHAGAKVRYILPGRLHQELDGLENPRADRPVRESENPFTGQVGG